MGRHKVVNGQTIQFTQAEEDARDVEEKAEAEAKPHNDALKEIKRLEGTVTARRLREALATDEGKAWVAAVETLIAVERGKL